MYANGEIIQEKIKRDFLPNIIFDKNKPSIIINDKKILDFKIIKNSDIEPYFYNINVIILDISVKINFSGLTQGWKIEIDTTCWTIPLPSARVNGTTIYGDVTETINKKPQIIEYLRFL